MANKLTQVQLGKLSKKRENKDSSPSSDRDSASGTSRCNAGAPVPASTHTYTPQGPEQTAPAMTPIHARQAGGGYHPSPGRG